MSARRPSSSRSTASKRNDRSTNNDDEDFEYQCKAGYLVVFDDLDDNITNEMQLREALQQSGRNPTRRILEKYWTKNTSRLTYDEFVDICRKIPVTTEEDLMKAFRKIDINGDGYITSNELLKTMTTRGEKMTQKEVKAIIDEVDENGDGKLDYKEFCKMMLSTQKEVLNMAKEQLQKKGHKGNRKSSTASHRPEASPRIKNKHDEESKDDSYMGSRTSLRASNRDLRSEKGNDDMGSQISLHSTTDSKQENVNMGSQVSMRSASKNKRLERRNSLTSNDRTENVNDQDIQMGSQVSLKAPPIDLKKPEKDKLGSQVSLKSQDSE